MARFSKRPRLDAVVCEFADGSQHTFFKKPDGSYADALGVPVKTIEVHGGLMVQRAS